jgi:creatinine amidohydrolase
MDDKPVSHNISYLAHPDIQWFLKRSDVILIPVGSCEQHGAHLPVGMDYIYPEEVTRRAAEKADVLYTPTIWTGYSPQHLRGPGARFQCQDHRSHSAAHSQ